MELEEMPPESAYRGKDMYTAEQLEGLETILAMRNANNIRWKLKVLGREARDPKKGRTLSANCWVRLDDYGNPEIIDESKANWGGQHKFVCARFCVDGMRIAQGDTVAFARSSGIKSIINGLSDYNVDFYRGTAVPDDIDYESEGVVTNHPLLWGWAGHDIDDCALCIKLSDELKKIEKIFEENNEKAQDILHRNSIMLQPAPEGYDFRGTLLIPYTRHSERLAGPEGQTVGYWTKYDDMVKTIDEHFNKIRTKRGKPKDVF